MRIIQIYHLGYISQYLSEYVTQIKTRVKEIEIRPLSDKSQ